MPFFMDRGHYASVVALLLAGDVQARAVANEDHSVIVVRLHDGREAIWGNTVRLGITMVGATWRFTLLEDGYPGGWVTELRMDATPEEVALGIATYDYPAPSAPIQEEPSIATYVEEPAEDEVGC